MLTAKLVYSQNERDFTFNPGDTLASALIAANVATSDVSWSASTIFVNGETVDNPRTYVLGSAVKQVVVGKLRTHG